MREPNYDYPVWTERFERLRNKYENMQGDSSISANLEVCNVAIDWFGDLAKEAQRHCADVLADDAFDALDKIHEIMSGKEWSADTLEEIAEAIKEIGYEIEEPA